MSGFINRGTARQIIWNIIFDLYLLLINSLSNVVDHKCACESTALPLLVVIGSRGWLFVPLRELGGISAGGIAREEGAKSNLVRKNMV